MRQEISGCFYQYVNIGDIVEKIMLVVNSYNRNCEVSRNCVNLLEDSHHPEQHTSSINPVMKHYSDCFNSIFTVFGPGWVKESMLKLYRH